MYIFVYTGLSPSMVQLSRSFYLNIHFILQSYNLKIAKTILIWAVPLSLATTKGITVLFSFPPGTEMFQFSGLALSLPTFSREGFPIRKSSDYRSFAPTRSLSQLITSFIASESQGIPHTLLVTFSLLIQNKYFIKFHPACQRT